MLYGKVVSVNGELLHENLSLKASLLYRRIERNMMIKCKDYN